MRSLDGCVEVFWVKADAELPAGLFQNDQGVGSVCWIRDLRDALAFLHLV